MTKPSSEQRLRDMLIECRDQFAYYARNHRAKDTPEALEKARVNEELVSKIAQVLS